MVNGNFVDMGDNKFFADAGLLPFSVFQSLYQYAAIEVELGQFFVTEFLKNSSCHFVLYLLFFELLRAFWILEFRFYLKFMAVSSVRDVYPLPWPVASHPFLQLRHVQHHVFIDC